MESMLVQYQDIAMQALETMLQDPNVLALAAMLQAQIGGTLLTYGAVGISGYIMGKKSSRKRAREQEEEVKVQVKQHKNDEAEQQDDDDVVEATEHTMENDSDDDDEEGLTLEELEALQKKIDACKRRAEKRARIAKEVQ